MGFHDYFSGHARAYADARPDYPDSLFEFLAEQCQYRRMAWDCATGNGQAASSLGARFQQVLATDAGLDQLAAGRGKPAILYCAALAEAVPLPALSVDLITVAQALHWFDLDRFFAECDRVLVSAGVLAVWSYDLCQVDQGVDRVTGHLYGELLDDFWPPQRRLVEDRYRSVNFPFSRQAAPDFYLRRSWRREHFLAYLRSWSATQRYLRARGTDPLALIAAELAAVWPDEVEKTVEWPLALFVCRK